MPIYEYRAPKDGCLYCRNGFDMIQKMSDNILVKCPRCGSAVKKAICTFRANVIERSESDAIVESKLKDYESNGQWSHAAELADKSGLQERARDNFKKAGYNF
jgi:putative FmdB family regulatory protein